MDRCLLWGGGNGYEEIINQIVFEIAKGNIEIVAIISDADSRYLKNKDGFFILKKEMIHTLDFDYLIITSTKYFEEIKKEAISAGIEQDRIIYGNIFKMPLFDWERYISLVKNPVSILSDDCWGGYVYHKLHLPFSSPCINISWDKEDYIRFVQNPLYYFDLPLEMEREGDIRKNLYPIGRLGEDDKKVTMNFVHAVTFQQAKVMWNRRKKRVNRERIFIKFAFPAYIENSSWLLEQFNKITFPKIAFFSGETNIKDVIYSPRFEWFVNQSERAETLIFSDYVRNLDYLFKDIDILKLLNNEENYIRFM